MAKTVADQFGEILFAAGVKRIYGIADDTLTGLTDAIRRQDKAEWLHIRHEEVAAVAAGAEAHLTGELAVCAGSCGPGNLHLMNAQLAATRQNPNSTLDGRSEPATLPAAISRYCQNFRFFRESRRSHIGAAVFAEFGGLSGPRPRTLAVRLASFRPV
jgi:hypothetical protein